MAKQTWIGLVRGINVGGAHIVPMAKLRELLDTSGFTNVRTYIQSGNIVAESTLKNRDKVGAKISDVIESEFGFRPTVLALSADELNNALQANPFPQAESEPKTLHFYFLQRDGATLNEAEFQKFAASNELYCLKNGVFYFYAPDGIGRSKLAGKVEKLLGVPTTARNLATVMAVVDLARDPSPS
jgi:uncharacterized protein (DUF1697 family)